MRIEEMLENNQLTKRDLAYIVISRNHKMRPDSIVQKFYDDGKRVSRDVISNLIDAYEETYNPLKPYLRVMRYLQSNFEKRSKSNTSYNEKINDALEELQIAVDKIDDDFMDKYSNRVRV